MSGYFPCAFVIKSDNLNKTLGHFPAATGPQNPKFSMTPWNISKCVFCNQTYFQWDVGSFSSCIWGKKVKHWNIFQPRLLLQTPDIFNKMSKQDLHRSLIALFLCLKNLRKCSEFQLHVCGLQNCTMPTFILAIGLDNCSKGTDVWFLWFDKFTFAKKKRKTKKKIENWTSLGFEREGSALRHNPKISRGCLHKASRPLPTLAASVLVRLCGKDTCVCDSVVCSLVLCDHVWKVCEKITATFREKKKKEENQMNFKWSQKNIYRNTALLISLRSEVKMFSIYFFGFRFLSCACVSVNVGVCGRFSSFFSGHWSMSLHSFVQMKLKKKRKKRRRGQNL